LFDRAQLAPTKDRVGMNKQEKIWQVVHHIPPGKVASYGQVAKMAGLPGYARYVGHTMKVLPAGTKLPWFRVVNAGGRISFEQGSTQYCLQKSLLESEGIVFINGRFSLRKYGWNQDDT
jgi:methylated-DNA-protein-cysteine methyltransferase-like protein